MTTATQQNEKLEALDRFAEIWDSYVIGDIATSLNCGEFEALLDLLVLAGMGPLTAADLRKIHAEGDECGDMHCACDDPECIEERSS